MHNKDVLFANKVLELRLIDQEKLKNCHTVQERLKKQGKNFTLSQVTIKLGFITPQQALSIHNSIKNVDDPPVSNIASSPPTNAPQFHNVNTNIQSIVTSQPANQMNSALFTNSTVQSYPRSLLDENDTFNHYIIEKKLGAGGMGAVYKVRDHHLQRSVALKVILGSGALNEKQIQRFLKEARATASLKHPNIVKVYEIGSQPQNYFTMELIQGRSLSALLRSKNLTPQKAAVIMKKCSEAIHYAHRQGIIHRDIKPSNIMMERNQEPKIMDFGLAKDVSNDKQISTTGDVLGTLCYMSPEQANGKETDARSDIYSLGATLYEVLCKRPPFQGESSMKLLCQIFTEEPIELRLLNPDIPKDLEAICLKCLHKKPEKRYQTAKQLADDLQNFLQNRPVSAQPVTRWIRIKKSIVRNKMLALFILFAFASLSIITVLAVRDQKATRDALEQAKTAETTAKIARENAEKERQKAEDAQKVAEEARKITEKAHQATKEALYKANIVLAKGYNDDHRLRDVDSALQQAKENMPEAETFWEYRWQKNRKHDEKPHFLSQTMEKTTVTDISVSGDLLIAIHQNTASLFNLKSKQQKELATNNSVRCCTISPNGLWAAVGDSFGNVFIWNTQTLTQHTIAVAEEKPPTHRDKFNRRGQQIQDLTFSHDSSALLIARQTIDEVRTEKLTHFAQSLLVVDIKQKKVVKRFSIPKKYLGIATDRRDKLYRKFIEADFICCDFSRDKKIIIGATEDRFIYAYSNAKKTRFFGPHESRIRDCKFHPINDRLIASVSGHNLYFWDYNVWDPKRRKKQQDPNTLKIIDVGSRITSLDFSPDGQQVIVGTQSGQIHLWKINIIQRDAKMTLELSPNQMPIFNGHVMVNVCTFLDKENIYSAGDGIKYWHSKTHKKPLKKDLLSPALFALFHPNEDIIISSKLTSIIFLDSKSGEPATINKRSEVFMHFSNVSHAQISKKGLLYTAGFDGSINICDLQTAHRLQVNSLLSKTTVKKLVLIDNETRIIAISDKSQIHHLQLNEQGLITKKQNYTIRDFLKQSTQFAKVPRNDKANFESMSWNKRDLVAITGQNRWLYLLNTKTMQLENIINIKYRNNKCFLEYDPQTKANYVFVTQNENIRKYKITENSLEEVATLIGHTDMILHMAKDPNSGRLISCGKDGSIHFWPKIGTKVSTSRKVNPYFTLKTPGTLSFCSFDKTGDKIVAVGGDDANHYAQNNPFLMMWDASAVNKVEEKKK